MRSRKNPYTKGAEALLRDLPEFRKSVLNVLLDGFLFEKETSGVLPPFEGVEEGLYFKESKGLNSFLINLSKTAILIEAVIKEHSETRVFNGLEILFRPNASDAVNFQKVLEIDDTYRLEVTSPILFSTKALCIYVAFKALELFLEKDTDVILLNKAANLITFEDFNPKDLSFSYLNYSYVPQPPYLPENAILEQADALFSDILNHTFKSEVGRYKNVLEAIELPPNVDFNGFEHSLTQFLIAAASPSIKEGVSWRRGLWSSLELAPHSAPKVELSAFKDNFFETLWNNGIFVEDFHARKQFGVFLAILGSLLASSDTTQEFKIKGTVRLVFARKEDATSIPELEFNLLKGDRTTFEIVFLNDARDAFLNKASIKKLLEDALSYVTSLDPTFSSPPSNTLQQLLDTNIIQSLERSAFGPYLNKWIFPDIPKDLRSSPYKSAFESLVLSVYVGIWTSTKDELELEHEFKHEIYQDNGSSERFGFSLFGKSLTRLQLNPILLDFVFFQNSTSGVFPLSVDVYIQMGYYLFVLGTLLSRMGDSIVSNYASVQIDFECLQTDEITPNVRWDFPTQLADGHIIFDSTQGGTKLSEDQINQASVLPRLRLTYSSSTAFDSDFFTQDGFERLQGQIISELTQFDADLHSQAVIRVPPLKTLEYAQIGFKTSDTPPTPKDPMARVIEGFRFSFEDMLLRSITQQISDTELWDTAHELIRQLNKMLSDAILTEICLDALKSVTNLQIEMLMSKSFFAQIKEMLTHLRSKRVIEKLSSLYSTQDISLEQRIKDLNLSITNTTPVRQITEIEAEREQTVQKRQALRIVQKEFSKLMDFMNSLESAIPKVTISNEEKTLAAEAFEALEATDAIEIKLDESPPPPSFDDDEALPLFEAPKKTLNLLSAIKYFKISSTSIASQIEEKTASHVASVDCIQLGELRAHLRTLRAKLVKLPKQLDFAIPATYCFEFSDDKEQIHVDLLMEYESLSAPILKVAIPQSIDLSTQDFEHKFLLAVSRGLESLIEFLNEDEDVDAYDIFDELFNL